MANHVTIRPPLSFHGVSRHCYWWYPPDGLSPGISAVWGFPAGQAWAGPVSDSPVLDPACRNQPSQRVY